jgi:hypothetical protein
MHTNCLTEDEITKFIKRAINTPYDAPNMDSCETDWTRVTARTIIAELLTRNGIGSILQDVSAPVRTIIIDKLSDIIRTIAKGNLVNQPDIKSSPTPSTVPLTTLLAAIYEDLDSPAEDIKKACVLINRVQNMTSAERETLQCAYKSGPLWDGDVPCKSARTQLVIDGLMAKVVVKGQDGFNACTYKGQSAIKLLQVMYPPIEQL